MNGTAYKCGFLFLLLYIVNIKFNAPLVPKIGRQTVPGWADLKVLLPSFLGHGQLQLGRCPSVHTASAYSGILQS